MLSLPDYTVLSGLHSVRVPPCADACWSLPMSPSGHRADMVIPVGAASVTPGGLVIIRLDRRRWSRHELTSKSPDAIDSAGLQREFAQVASGGRVFGTVRLGRAATAALAGEIQGQEVLF
jgi:hypothetical protein